MIEKSRSTSLALATIAILGQPPSRLIASNGNGWLATHLNIPVASNLIQATWNFGFRAKSM
ncbi:hypothetical protein [Nitrosomonas sp. ANs5]|uniref:hypothetical protein n=1 Tax=Nitrosomonas sp. ANs5 TaxID=3423941 RepID=UPI003D324A6F